ncbi:MAG: prepilin-type N-terminal cleavage/methylation domain-containing protein [Candidatus Omnitrophica bacterium]|nr:prepilin-type N-terminal cleavage/methylation domain-containing protein [Candidatus Omnitrophota bacterium]
MKKILSAGFWRGFTLVEIVIVVAIIGVLVALGTPNFLRIKMNANEEVVRSDLRAFCTANESSRSFSVPPIYAENIPSLIDGGFLDSTWLNPGNKHGYVFTYRRNALGTSYSLEAGPLIEGVTGAKFYCLDATGVIVIGSASGLGTEAGCVGGIPLGG